ncbi:MAG: protein phosphatase CheZ [Zoogloeaceae bacterium]|jgi:chemotaxis protein CheZ|nr:protein phosphatase CheZ [Zoogloeaceae bacterium]
MTADNDSPDLEALFDSVAASARQQQFRPAPQPAQASPSDSGGGSGDSEDLQALFEQVAAARTASGATATGAAGGGQAASPEDGDWSTQESTQERVFQKIGQMARQLHTTLHELGYDKLLEQTVTTTIPDAKDRLAYVATLTEQAASRVLNATDIARPIVEEMERNAKNLGARWERVFANQMGVAEFRQLAEETRACLVTDLPRTTEKLNAQLTEIMMAQDFQDLTGQVIKKIVSLAQDLEDGLVKALIDVVPVSKRSEEVASLMNGPVINAEGRADVVVNQQQVDDLLESLGF